VGPGFILSVAGHTGGKRAISSWPVSGTGYERVGILGCLLSGLDVNNIKTFAPTWNTYYITSLEMAVVKHNPQALKALNLFGDWDRPMKWLKCCETETATVERFKI
jgi:hypothetical protein